MNVVETSRRVRRGERRLVRLQRRLWLAQLALWPTVILLAILLAAAGWVLWRRSAARQPAAELPVAPPPTAPGGAHLASGAVGGDHAP